MKGVVMKRLFTLLALASLLLALAGPPAAAARGPSPASLAAAGWDCLLPPPFNPNVHCSPPGLLEGVISGEAESGMWFAFATDDLSSTDAPFLGAERVIRADLYNGQPCPTDPPSYEYSWLFPRFGWDYYICHTFDSPW
jgi:hypothetical protein